MTNSGKFHFQRSSLNKAAPKIYIDLSELIEKIQWIEYSISIQEQAIFDIPHLEVIYEDDLVDPSRHQETVKRISNYLGIHNELVQTKWVKYSDDLSQTITNVDEIKSKHVGTPADTDRSVIDSSYSFCLVVAFDSKKEHDIYQAHPLHLRQLSTKKGVPLSVDSDHGMYLNARNTSGQVG